MSIKAELQEDEQIILSNNSVRTKGLPFLIGRHGELFISNKRLVFKASILNGFGKDIPVEQLKNVEKCFTWHRLIVPFPLPDGIRILYGKNKKFSLRVKERDKWISAIKNVASVNIQ